MKKIEIDAVELVDLTLMLNTIKAAGLGQDDFLKRCQKKIDYLRKEYVKQTTPEEQSKVAKKILKMYKVKL